MIEILLVVVLSIMVTVVPINFFYYIADAFKYYITAFRNFISIHS